MLEKNYNPKDFEEKIYADWENSGDFKPDMSKNRSEERRVGKECRL